jgi:YD repeat-containing protein
MVKNNKLNLLAKLISYFAIMINISFKQPWIQVNFNKNFKWSFTTFLLFLIGNPSSYAQYYYKDIWNNHQISDEFKLLKNDDFKTIKIRSFDDDGQPSEGFFCEKKINKKFTQSQMISKSNITGQSVLVSDYNTEGLTLKTTEETPTTTNITEFDYDGNGQLKMTVTITKADGDSGEIRETHEYSYDQKGIPVKMIRKKNDALVSTIHFVSDANGNIIEENAEGSSINDKKYYYYYDSRNRLTDVVHFNELAKRLLPDYMFEYNTSNQLKQMITVNDGSSNYLIWKYAYNENNLRQTEKCFSKDKRLLGTIEYEYDK